MDTYHPRRRGNEIIDEEQKRTLVRRGNHITIAMSKDDNPYIVTMSYGWDEAGNCLYFHCANKGDKLDYVLANPRVCATIIKDNGYLETRCDHDYETLVIRGPMRVVDSLEEKKHGLQVLLNHLEKDPQPIFDRNIKDDRSYDTVTILRLDLESVIGKKYVG